VSGYGDKGVGYFSTARHEILAYAECFSGRVLEVGCGSGQTLEMLKSKGFCSETVGVELFKFAADEAVERVDSVYCMNVEAEGMPAHIGRFNIILLLDVLEHLVDPWAFIDLLRRDFLAVGGKMVVSLPNAQHFSLVLPLLCGRFTYVERGVLDKTHLRFFTKKSAIQLFVESSMKVDRVIATSLSLALNSGKLNLVTFGFFSSFIASQYVFLLSVIE
jgi:2-polyprenyl-3-methyl-5-hydroxy-6-metoxy-1,4-benzoquinol methylase